MSQPINPPKEVYDKVNNIYTLTKDQITKIFEKWTTEYSDNPEEFDPEGTPEDHAQTFIDYLNSLK